MHASVDNMIELTATLLHHHSVDQVPAGSVFTKEQRCLLLVHCMVPALASTGGHLLALPFSEDSCASSQLSMTQLRQLLPMLMILIYLLAR